MVTQEDGAVPLHHLTGRDHLESLELIQTLPEVGVIGHTLPEQPIAAWTANGLESRLQVVSREVEEVP